ncbi:hypothetical protein [Streptomyces sp. SBT349]|uniref:hypothetical protein n=1 Tax=Streptomyces sp. SBT349 TaxID=1580539 RepID=UPI00066D4811|nr:hypothetical protein [Streptomyces sp. SBT349]
MTTRPTPWIGDEVHDEDAGRDGIVTDVRDGIYVLRPPLGTTEWTSAHPHRLTVVVPREQRQETILGDPCST